MVSSVLRDARRIVVKVGSSLVTTKGVARTRPRLGSGAASWLRKRGDGGAARSGHGLQWGDAEGMKRLGSGRPARKRFTNRKRLPRWAKWVGSRCMKPLREQGIGSAQVLPHPCRLGWT